VANVTKVLCEVCGIEKKETNHWYMVGKKADKFLLLAWHEQSQRNYRHVCGQQCGHKLLDEFFQKVSAQS